MQSINRETINLTAADGCELPARWWHGAQAQERSVLFIPAIAAPQGYLGPFASHLAERGWGVLTFDYRSVGAAKARAVKSDATLDDWVELDLPAAAAEIKRRTGTQFLCVIAHSIGGQLFGQSPVRHLADGALLIGAQRGIPSLYKGLARLQVEYAYTIFPLLIRLFGHLPTSKLTLPERCSGQALRQWIKWGRTGVFTNRAGINVESRYHEYEGPLTAVTLPDDVFAPPAAVEALTRLYTNADVRREAVRARDYGVDHIGHFDFFQRRAPRALWEQAVVWLREMETAAHNLKATSA